MWNKAGVVTVLFLSLIQMAQIMDAQEIKLPTCEFAGGKSFMQAVADRRSVREFDAGKQIPDSVLGSVLWASVGVNRNDAVASVPGKNVADRSNPTALNSQEIHAYVFGKEGVWEYMPHSHSLRQVAGAIIVRWLQVPRSFRRSLSMMRLIRLCSWHILINCGGQTGLSWLHTMQGLLVKTLR